MELPNSSLHQAVNAGDLNAIRAIIAGGADVNATNESGQTPLIVGIVKGHYQLVDLLLSCGADPLLRDSTGLNAIQWAERKGHTDLAQSLLNSTRTGVKPSKPTPPPKEEPSVEPQAKEDQRAAVSDEEKSRRFIAGLRQRLEEKAKQESAITPLQTPTSVASEAPREIPAPPRPDKGHSDQAASDDDTKPSGPKKRCPECGRIYDGERLGYCVYHEVALVEADTSVTPPVEPAPTPEKTTPTPIVWILIAAALAIGSFTGYLIIDSLVEKPPENVSPKATPTPIVYQKGIPELSQQLAGKAEVLPEAQVPANTVAELTTITVRVRIDRDGRVFWASSTIGEQLLRDAAIEAAKNSTFSIEKLRGRGATGTISYTFK